MGVYIVAHPDLDSHEELRSGRTPWQHPHGLDGVARVAHDMRCDVLIVGAGITGSMLAARLSAGISDDVVLIDRERAGGGSTAASTAMLLWELDTSLAEMALRKGFDRAAHIYRLSFQAAQGLSQWIEALGIVHRFARRSSVLLSPLDAEPGVLRDEHSLRVRAELPSHYLAGRSLEVEFGLLRPAALCSSGAAEADPTVLARAFLRQATQQKARLLSGDVVRFESHPRGAAAFLDDGTVVEARNIVLATGYDLPSIIPSTLHQIVATWVVATQPVNRIWPQRALLWEASTNYLYARTMGDRIIVGGEDDAQAVELPERDALTAAKAARLMSRLASLWRGASEEPAFKWSGAFGKTVDGLPLIGPMPGWPNLYGAYGYGGNGITFSYLAAEIISQMLQGKYHASFEHFAIDRSDDTDG